jgi:hypothetical protein
MTGDVMGSDLGLYLVHGCQHLTIHDLNGNRVSRSEVCDAAHQISFIIQQDAVAPLQKMEGREGCEELPLLQQPSTFSLQPMGRMQFPHLLAQAPEPLVDCLEAQHQKLPEMTTALEDGPQRLPPFGKKGHHRGCGGGGAVIRDQIRNGGVVLMPEAAHHRHWKLRQCPRQGFPIEDGQVFPAASTTGQHHGIDRQFLGLMAECL